MRSTDEARTQFAENLEPPLALGAGRSVFGDWIRPGMFGDASGRGRRVSGGEDSITAAGQAASDAFDPITENPAIHCKAGSPVNNWGPPGLATTIRQVNSEIFIYQESMDVTRTVHMNLSEHPADIEPSDMGHSIGRWEDRVLIIDTEKFAAGVLTGSTQHTDQMTLEERLSITPDKGRLLISWIASDPEYYAEPLTGSQELQPTSQDIIRYECIPGAPTGYAE